MSDPAMPSYPGAPRHPSLGDKIAAIREKWGWFLALGVGLLIVGFIALGMPVAGTIASVWVFGVLMIIGGIAQIFHAFQVRGWGSFFLWLVMGVVYLAAGVFAIAQPVLASVSLTLIFGFIIIAAGAMRIAVGLQTRPSPGWGWMTAAGVINALFGVAILAMWPGSSLILFGTLLGIDLVFQGVAAIAFGLALRAHRIP